MSSSTIFRYPYDGHEIEVAPPHKIYIDGTSIQDKQYGAKSTSNIFASTTKYQLNNGDVFEVSRQYEKKDPRQPLLPNEYLDKDKGVGGSVYSFTMKVNGIELEPIPQRTRVRDIKSMQQLSNAYEHIGNLSKADFLAVKKLIGCDVHNNYAPFLNLKIGNGSIPIQPDAIRVGDSIECALENKLGIYNKTMYIPSVKNVSIEQGRMPSFGEALKHSGSASLHFNEVVIDGGNSCVTNIPFDKEVKLLEKLIESGQMDLAELKDIIPADATLDEFQIVQELHGRDIQITEPLLEELAKGLTVDDALENAYERFAELTFDGNEISENDEIDGPEDITFKH